MGWVVNGIGGLDATPPPYANSEKGLVIILAGGRSVWRDWEECIQRGWDRITRNPQDGTPKMAINDVGQFIHQDVRHWVSLHPNYFPGWMNFRVNHAYNRPMTHTYKSPYDAPDTHHADILWDIHHLGGTSGMFACTVALALGFNRVILCGMPMDGGGHFWEPPWYRSPEIDNHADKIVWRQAVAGMFQDRVKSLSGNTRLWCGAPTEDWVNGGPG